MMAGGLEHVFRPQIDRLFALRRLHAAAAG
jgi:hypothetical protein